MDSAPNIRNKISGANSQRYSDPMSGSDQVKGNPFIEWLFPVIGILLACFVAWGVGYLHGQQQERANTTYRYEKGAAETASRECVGIERTSFAECVVEKVEAAREAAHDKQDLTAQQQAAWAAIFSSIWALAGTGAAVLGLIWIKGTLDATRIGAEAAQGAVNETKRIGEAQARAYLAIDKVWVTRDSKGPFKVEISVRNTGASPAFEVSPTFSIANTEDRPRDWQSDFKDEIPSNSEVILTPCYLPSDIPHQTWMFIRVKVSGLDVFEKMISTENTFVRHMKELPADERRELLVANHLSSAIQSLLEAEGLPPRRPSTANDDTRQREP